MKYILIFLLILSSVQAGTTLVVFGATGDLTKNKLLPAFHNLRKEQEISLIGFARREFKEPNTQAIQSSFDEDKGYNELRNLIENGNRIYYLATHPDCFVSIVQKLHEHGLLQPEDRLIFEKPFGTDLSSAIELQKNLVKYLDEKQIYRMDHYLGKQGVANLIDFRLFHETRWNKEQIESVEITLSEEIGIGERGKYFEESGALRDLFQNHLLQLLAIATMEDHDKTALFNKVRLSPEDVTRGQYKSYREEKNVAKDSHVETFVSAKLFIDNDRWQGVPFILSCGKKLRRSVVEIVVHFKNGELLPLCIQPLEGHFEDAYTKLLRKAIVGDKSFFVSYDECIAEWRIVTPILEYWKNHPETNLIIYGE